MTWTTPNDRTPGFLVTSAIYDAEIIDNLKYLHGDAGAVALGAQVAFGDQFGSSAIGGDGTHSGWLLSDNGTSATLFSVGTVNGASVIGASVAGDVTDFRFTLGVDGTMLWGPGSGARDTRLARTAAGVLKVSNALREVKATITYAASMTPDASAGEWQTITVTNGTAFTINNPTNPPASNETQWLHIEIFNNSGGAMGAVTWGSAFRTSALVPANGQKVLFSYRWSGTAWVIVNASGPYT